MAHENLEDSWTYPEGRKTIFKAVFALKENGYILSKLERFCKLFLKTVGVSSAYEMFLVVIPAKAGIQDVPLLQTDDKGNRSLGDLREPYVD